LSAPVPKARYTLATVKLALSKYRNAIRAVDPDHLVLRPRKMHSGQRFSYLALEPEETRALNAAYHERIHRDQSDLIPLDPEAFIQTALELLAGDRYLQKGMGLMALTGRRPAEIFFSASFSLHYLGPFEAYGQTNAETPFREDNPRLPGLNSFPSSRRRWTLFSSGFRRRTTTAHGRISSSSRTTDQSMRSTCWWRVRKEFS
jgi:hypothetical protein